MKNTKLAGVVLVVLGLAILGDAFGFTTLGGRWARTSVPVGYFTNPAGLIQGWEGACQQGHATWNNVTNQFFRFTWRGQTGRQAESWDGQSVVSRMVDNARYGSSVLAVTFTRGGGNYTEFDMAWNTRWNWALDPSGGIDVVGVASHEFGHALGLGHSNVGGATMWPSYHAGARSLAADDIAGVRFLYPGGGTSTGATVSGTVREANGGGAANVVMTATINGASRTFTTTATGAYNFVNVPAGSLTLRPTRANTVFTPVSRTVQVGTTNIAGQDFTVSTGQTAGVTVGGRVTNLAGQGVGGVSIAATINGQTRNTTTDAQGVYTFLRVPQGTLRLTPSRAGMTFNPAFRQVAVGTTNIFGQVFTGQ